VRTLKTFQGTHILGASRGLLCDSYAVLLLLLLMLFLYFCCCVVAAAAIITIIVVVFIKPTAGTIG